MMKTKKNNNKEKNQKKNELKSEKLKDGLTQEELKYVAGGNWREPSEHEPFLPEYE